MDIPTTHDEWWHRNKPLFLATFSVFVPLMIFWAILPTHGADGPVSVGGLPRLIFLALAVAPFATGVLAAVFDSSLRADHELLFGCGTLFVVLTTVVVFASVFVRHHLENAAALTFSLMAVLSIATLILVAHDWARRQLVAAALVITAALSLFVVRIGHESLQVPPAWARTQIADQAQEEESALKAQHHGAWLNLINDATSARTTLSGILSSKPRLSVQRRLRTQANVILGDAIVSLTTVKTADFKRFDVLAMDEPTTYPPTATTALSDAVHALKDAETAAAFQADSSALDKAIASVRRQKISSNFAWVTAQHKLDVELATYRAKVTGTDADNAALSTVLAQQPSLDDNVSLLSAIENGPETLWGSAFGSAGPPIVPGPVGWAILGALILGLLGWLLKVNASQLAGPVEVLDDTAEKNLTTVLRVAVLQNVAEPGAAPGAPSANPVTTLLDIAAGPASVVGKIAQSVLAVAGRRYGYQVGMDVTTDPLPDSGTPPSGTAAPAAQGTAAVAPVAGSTTVLVRVKSIAGGITLASYTFTKPAADDAVEAAGLWAAGFILSQSTRIPGWAAWNAETANALAKASNRGDNAVPLKDLQAALPEAPDSGILLTQLGHLYELDGRRLDAINCYARAVRAHPHYWVARYRLAGALGAMHFGRDKDTKLSAEEQDTLLAVEPAIKALHVDVGTSIVYVGTSLDSANFKCLADKLFQSLAKDTLYPYRLVSALRRSERDSTWPSLSPGSTSLARRFHELVKSAYLSFDSLDKDKLRELADMAAKAQSWWQISYNAACGYASLIGTPEPTDDDAIKKNDKYAQQAMSLLGQALVRPGIHQLSAQWAQNDPALANLASDPRFIKFLAQLRPGD